MYVLTAKEMQEIDRYMIDTIGVPAMALMENAGREAASEIEQFVASQLGSRNNKYNWLILAGKGNNGGDGWVVARHLWEAGYTVTVIYADEEAELTKECASQRRAVEKLGIASLRYAPNQIQWGDTGGIVDALLGVGAKGAPREPYASIIREANESGVPIIALDIPSGVDADTGETHEPFIRATQTVAFAFLKRGLMQYPGAEAAGTVKVKRIGIPQKLALTFKVQTYQLSKQVMKEVLHIDLDAARKADTHKGTYGHVLILAGSSGMSGAGMLCTKAALRSGSGLVTWALPQQLADKMAGAVPEAMLAGIADGGRGDWADTSAASLITLANQRIAAVIGPGIGRFPGDGKWLRELWEGITCPLVLDADALNMIADAGDFAAWPRRKDAAILTPHPGEMARLAGVPVHEVQRDRIGLAQRFAEQHGVTLVLKGARTVVATPDGVVFINTTGNPGMATGGAGDVLAGVIAGLRAQGLDAGQAAALGVYWHGAAGDRAAAKRFSPGSLIAGDIIEHL